MAGGGSSLKSYLLVRTLLVIPTIFILLTLVFVLMRVAPGNPVSAALGGHVPQAVIQEISHRLGYDRPLYQQFGSYLWNLAHGDFGATITDKRQVSDIILVNGAATLELTLAAAIVALAVGIPIGLIAGRFRDRPIDAASRIFGIIMYAMPVFVLGLLAQIVFGSWLGWLPISDQASPMTSALMTTHTNLLLVDAVIDGDWDSFWDVLQHLVLPAGTLGLVFAGVFVRLVRINVIRTLKDDYIEAARARGIREQAVVYRHAFRNALVPVITVIGLEIALLMGGAVLTETTFNWPGIGHALYTYLQNRDYAAVQGIVIVFGLVVVFASLLVDILSALIDPRMRYQ
ncbi:ABC transporter permease [Acidimangrovimonas sediminis]|uniref:ABC transporter permease n=1 Tax=Acidimangrovimonas sediminis TaxID=2056283 RepID=UPI000C8024F4|nr:ABC transporter permease [Acidimangrovimonas sediminis]